jgi:hypothetical protein
MQENHFSLILLCSVDQFFDIMDDFIIERDYSHTDPFGWVRDKKVFPGMTHNLVYLWDKKSNHKTLTFMKVVNVSDKKIRLRVHYYQKEWDKLKVYWETFYRDLNTLGLISEGAQLLPESSADEKNRTQKTYHIPSSIESSKVDEYTWLEDVNRCKKIYPGYNFITAINIIEAFKPATANWKSEGGEWGPRFFAEVININSTTAARYLKVLKELGINFVDGIAIPSRTRHQKPKSDKVKN